ncbi:MAG: response regulator [Lachnospiraceae bacterium]|nr:response regulator [Lachnospiraceae bacterium]
MIRAVICDDEKAALIIIRHFIDMENLPIEIVGTAENGRDALKLIQTEKPDLVFLDIQMPYITGLEVLGQIKDSKVIIITAYDSFSHAQQALRLGASDIIAKPIDMEQLRNAIIRAIGWEFTENDLTNQVIAWLHLHYMEQIRLNQLSEMMFCSPSHLAHTFKKYTGCTLLNYVHKLRITESIRMLKNGESVKEAALRVGYQNLNHYYKYFKEFTGKTPAQYGRGGSNLRDEE